MSATADDIAAWLVTRPPRAGRTRVLAVDGRAGAGKSTLAAAVADRLAAPLVRMDDLYAGWDGLTDGVAALRDWVLAPLAAGLAPSWRRYDWYADSYGEWQHLPSSAAPCEGTPAALIVDGVGSGAASVASYLSGLVWVLAPDEARRRRALDRDGDTFAPHWDRWAAHEDGFYAADPVAARADWLFDNGV